LLASCRSAESSNQQHRPGDPLGDAEVDLPSAEQVGYQTPAPGRAIR
jgi:hypothetical protein